MKYRKESEINMIKKYICIITCLLFFLNSIPVSNSIEDQDNFYLTMGDYKQNEIIRKLNDNLNVDITFKEHKIIDNLEYANCVYATDLDKDKDIDIICSGWLVLCVIIFLKT